MSAFRRFVELNYRLAERANALLGPRYSTDGNDDFLATVPWAYMKPGSTVYDVGGGSEPFFSPEDRAAHRLFVIGVDISVEELEKAPSGAYDDTLVADVMDLQADADGDLVICQALLEHVPDVERAIHGLRTSVKPGGYLCVFVPCRNALFARLNLALPQPVKRRVLFRIFPHMEGGQGFPIFYDRCTPGRLETLFADAGFELVEERRYYLSHYFFFFFPLYLVWQAWVLAASVVAPRRLCETTSMVLRRKATLQA